MKKVQTNSGVIFTNERVINNREPQYKNKIKQKFSINDSPTIIITSDNETDLIHCGFNLCTADGKIRPLISYFYTPKETWCQLPLHLLTPGDIAWVKVTFVNTNNQVVSQPLFSNPFCIIGSEDGGTFSDVTNVNTKFTNVYTLIEGYNDYKNGRSNGLYYPPSSSGFGFDFQIRVACSWYRTPYVVTDETRWEGSYGARVLLKKETYKIYSLVFTDLTNEMANVVRTLCHTDNLFIGGKKMMLFSDDLVVEEIGDSIKEYSLRGDFVEDNMNDIEEHSMNELNILEDPMNGFIDNVNWIRRWRSRIGYMSTWHSNSVWFS